MALTLDTFDADKHRRRSIRLPDYDYSQPGAYFVTISTQSRLRLFGYVEDADMRLNEAGRLVARCWEWLAVRYRHVSLDQWIIMPDHLHGIIVLNDDPRRGGSRAALPGKRKPLGQLIGAFKTASTKRLNEVSETPGATVWQRNYYEHVVRDEEELAPITSGLAAVREYIAHNPARWREPIENPRTV